MPDHPVRPAASLPARLGPVPVLRRAAAEPAMILGGQRALLLQVAHPLVAAGVEHHSGFRGQPVQRLWSTIDALMCLVWGREAEAVEARHRILRTHDRVHGGASPAEATSSVPIGTRYSAHDPALLWWVWATLVDTTEVVHDRLLEPLDPTEREALHTDWVRLAAFLGIPDHLLDADRATFRRRFVEHRDRLELSATARHVARSIVDPPLWFVPRPVRAAYALLATSLLDDRTRALYDLPWDPDRAATAAALEAQVRAAWALVPGWRRRLPDLYLTGRRAWCALGVAALPATPGRDAAILPTWSR